MSDSNNNLTDIITLRGKKISTFDEIRNVTNRESAYILITVRLDNGSDEPVYVNQKISLENFLHVLLGDDSDSVLEKFTKFFNGSNVTYSNYVNSPNNILEKNDGVFHLHLETLNAVYDVDPENGEKYLSEGVIDNDILQRYVGDVETQINDRIDVEVSNIMRYIGLDKDDVVNTLIEIIDWFNEWRTTEGNDTLQKLINKIKNDYEDYTDQKITDLRTELSNAINSSINSLNVPKIGDTDELITSVSQTNGKISATSTSVSSLSIGVGQINGLEEKLGEIQNLTDGTNIEIDDEKHINCLIEVDSDHNSFTVSSTEYSLQLVGNKLQISQYVELTVTANSTKYFERDSGQQTISLSSTASGTNEIENSAQWITSTNGYTVSSTTRNGKKFTATGTTKQDNTEGSFSITIHQKNPAVDKTTKVSVRYTQLRIWCFQTTNASYQVTLDDNQKPENLPNDVFYSECHTTEPTFSANSTSNGYIYILMPSTWTTNNFYFGSPLNEQKSVKQTLNIYSSPGIEYTLYRSDQPLGIITFEYTKK